MSTTFLPNKNVGYPAIGDTGWGLVADASLQNIDNAFGGNQAFDLSSASGVVAITATSYNGPYPSNTASYIPASWTLTGTLTANVNLQLPSGVGGQWNIFNGCNGAFTITVSSVGGGATATLESGGQTVYCDGLNNVGPTSSFLPSGATFRGVWPGTQSTGVGVFTTLNYTALTTPAWGTWNGNTMTISHSGLYLINAMVSIQGFYSSSVSGKIRAGIYVNNNSVSSVQSVTDTTGIFVIGMSTIASLAPTNTVNVQAFVYNTSNALTSSRTFNGENNIAIVKIA